MEVVGFSESFVEIQQDTRRHIPDDWNIETQLRQDIKCYRNASFFTCEKCKGLRNKCSSSVWKTMHTFAYSDEKKTWETKSG
jgi:hypothetical protein